MSEDRPPVDKDTTSDIHKGGFGNFRLPELPKSNNLRKVFTGKGGWYDYFLLILLIGMFNPWTVWYAWPIGMVLIMYENHIRERNAKEKKDKEIQELKNKNLCTSCKKPL